MARTATSKKSTEPVDQQAVLKELEEIERLSDDLKARKAKVRKHQSKVLKEARERLKKTLGLQPVRGGYYNREYREAERKLILDKLAKAVAAGRIVICEDDEK